MKDAARLLGYFVMTLVIGALLAPILYWSAQWLGTHDMATFLARYDFEKFFHRALLVAALVLLWPLLRMLQIRSWAELGLVKNQRASRDVVMGFLLAAVPLFCCGLILLVSHRFALRASIPWKGLTTVIGATVFVPIVEELFFRGVILGVLLRRAARWFAIMVTSALYSILHFLKAPEQSPVGVDLTSGFVSVANSFGQFHEPMLVAAGFTTLFLIGWILADARVRTRSLWLAIGLHAGWIFSSGFFNKVAKQQMVDLPWLGKSLLIGIVPLSIGLLTWLLLRAWLRHEATGAT